jgi:hypothetical protein
MCNPRRIHVTATRRVREAWQREVERVAEVVDTVTGEARIVQSLDASLGGSALMALRGALARGFPGWSETAGGSYRHDVPGGYLLFDPDASTLEIVATLSESLRSQTAVRHRLTGEIDETLTAGAEASYYDDGFGGQTEERAREAARQDSERELDRVKRRRLDEAAAAAERVRNAALSGETEAAARRVWQAAADERRRELSVRAAVELEEVGGRARQAFHRLLAHSYREALLALARRRGVAPEAIHQRESGDTLEIEFLLPD